MRLTLLKVALVSVVLSLCLCKGGQSTSPTKALTAADFRVTTEFPGWTEDTLGYRPFADSQGLCDIIDGGCVIYQQDGVISGAIQYMSSGPDTLSQTFEGYVMNFRNSDSAQKIFDDQKLEANTVDSFPPYSKSVAFSSAGLGSVTVCAHEQTFFFKVRMQGYPNIPAADSSAKQFVDFYFSIAR